VAKRIIGIIAITPKIIGQTDFFLVKEFPGEKNRKLRFRSGKTEFWTGNNNQVEPDVLTWCILLHSGLEITQFPEFVHWILENLSFIPRFFDDVVDVSVSD
jgi:hypothetical protein